MDVFTIGNVAALQLHPPPGSAEESAQAPPGGGCRMRNHYNLKSSLNGNRFNIFIIFFFHRFTSSSPPGTSISSKSPPKTQSTAGGAAVCLAAPLTQSLGRWGELQPQSQQLPLPIHCSTALCRLPAGPSRLKINPGSSSSNRRDKVRALCSAGAAPLLTPWLPHRKTQGSRAAVTAPGHRMCGEVDTGGDEPGCCHSDPAFLLILVLISFDITNAFISVRMTALGTVK